MAIQKTNAFVLQTRPFRSSSLIVTFFSKDFGKMRGIAKGVRREREVRGATFELFTNLEIIFYEKLRSDLHLVSEASILESLDGLRTRLDTIAYASYFVDLIDRVCEVHDPHPEIYELLQFAMKFLPSVPSEKLLRLFEVRLLREIGWIPLLDQCMGCLTRSLERAYFSIPQGALLCPRCSEEYPEAKRLSPEALRVLLYYDRNRPEQSLKLHLSPATDAELRKLMGLYLLYRLGRPLRSRQFIDQIEPVLNP